MLKSLATLYGHDDRVWCVAWNPKGTLLATSSGDRTIKLWSYQPNVSSENGESTSNQINEKSKWSCVDTLVDGHTRTVRWISWSPCGNKLASASFDASIVIWKRKPNSQSFESIAHLEGHENEVKCTAWSYDGAYLASCSRDRSVWIWDVSDSDDMECSSVLTIHDQDVKHVLWHPHKNLLVSSSYDDTIKFSAPDIDDWSCVATLTSHNSTVWSCDFNVDGDRLVSASDDKTLKIWKQIDSPDQNNENQGDDINWKCICTVNSYHSRAIYSVKWSNLNNLIATACSDNSIHIFKEDPHASEINVAENNELLKGHLTSIKLVHHEKNAHTQDCNCVDWHPKQSNIFASCSDDGSIKIWMLTGDIETL